MASPHRFSGYSPSSPQARISSDHARPQYRATPHHSRELRPTRYPTSNGPAPPPHTAAASRHRQHHPSPPAYRPQRSTTHEQQQPPIPRQSRDGYPNHQSQQQQQQQYRTSSSRLAQAPVDSSSGLRNRGLGNRPPAAASYYAAHRNASLSRSRSLSRPERYRPRPGMLRGAVPSPPQPPAHQQPGATTLIDQRYRHHPPRVVSVPEQPMSNRLQMQLQQQKIQQQREAGLSTAPRPQRKPSKKEKQAKEEDDADARTTWWAWIAFAMTCCIPGWCLRVCCRKQNALTRQAWREKIALVLLILLLCLALVYITYGLIRTLCPEQSVTYPYSVITDGNRVPMYRKDVRVFGRVYPLEKMQEFFATKGLNLTTAFENMELGPVFDGDLKGACNAFGTNAALGSCSVDSPYGGTITGPNGGCLSLRDLNNYMRPQGTLNFEWADMDPQYVQHAGELTLLGNTVINMTTYFRNGTSVFGSTVDKVLQDNVGKDISYVLLYTPEGKDAAGCLLARYSSGIIESEAGGCIAAQIIMNIMLAVIVAMIVVRYSMALTFQWFIAGRLVKPGGRSNWLAWRSIKGGNDDPANHIPGPYNYYASTNAASSSSSSIHSSSSTRATPRSDQRLSVASDKAITTDIVNTELYTVMLVTCYSEGQEGLQTTMDSLAKTTYSRKHKLFFIVADGMITGAGEKRPTPDIVVDMMDLDPTMRDPTPAYYVAIADGEKQLNMAKVYAGHYRGVPCITIVKCGTEEEANKPKAGNRGKRDSQLIVMQFFQRVLFNDRLTELDYEIFWKMTWLMKGVTPDKFELILMVDADTKVLPDALTYMVAAMANDITIMGLCGETRIANKRASWVTAIQVFEYYISHNYAKAFESLFGIVTCLPGCFSMYRIKAPKNGAWVPILANPDIILEYNQNVVTTLHAKNLLLLGEDRFLSTLMLRTFPRRQMMFVPQARCKTVVPDQFKVLLSQRRRWINSTVHNLMELVLVSDLCGIACLSMQFSVFVDLIGTLVLPAAICLTIYLIVSTAVSSNPQWQSLALLVAILGLPAVLIGITTFKIVYIMWMLVYIIALPIWNFILPVYAYWHFDDFSWGATRKVDGEKKDKHDMDPEGKFDSSRLVMKKWEDWEAERTGQRLQPRHMPTLRTPMDPPSISYGNSPPRSVTPLFSNRQMFAPPTHSNV